ncbi:MAG TPA: hypothetical protein VLE73_05765 [Candidatus Saccharimonadales bacterium]|nr:hypothetical protein [Candidatus Saccharimonadales bacterium]
MRLFESLLLGLVILAFCRLSIPYLRSLSWLKFSVFLPLIAAVLQYSIEGPRWQLYPAYTFALVLGIIGLIQLAYAGRLRPNLTVKIGGTVIGLLVIIISVSLLLLFPVFTFEKPSGPYHIGTRTYFWTDASRADILSDNPTDTRQIVAQVWYPAANTPSPVQAPYVGDATAISTGLTRDFGLPSFVFDHFRYVKTHAIPNAPIATDKPAFPVLIYLTGLGGFRQASMFQIEALVSHGYVVVGLDQPYVSIATKLASGQIVYALPQDKALPAIYQSISPSKSAPSINGHSLPEGVIPYLAKDATFALDKITALNTASDKNILAGHLDLDHTGVFGVSLGAMAAGEVCHEDRRFDACLMMDAAMPQTVATSGLQQPSLWLTRPVGDMQAEGKRSDSWTDKDTELTLPTIQSAFNKSATGNGYYVSIAGMFHHNFFDIPSWSPALATAGLVGPINAQRGFDIINAYSLSFFDQTLKGQSQPLLLESSHSYPEVTLQKR